MKIDEKAILYMVAKKFGLKRDSFEERLKLQKIIYLLQDSGMQLGYGFGWYKYGPYSQDLVSDAYTVLKSRRSEYERAESDGKWDFNAETKAKFEAFKETFDTNSLEELEMLTSVRFVKKMWFSDTGKDDFVTKFKQYKTRLYNNQSVEDEKIKEAFDFWEKSDKQQPH